MDTNKIGKYIAKLRKEKGLTQQELGDKLFVTDKAVSKWERGLSLPDIAILEKLSLALETDIYDILQIEKKKDVDIEKILCEERLKLKKKINKKIIMILIPVFFLFLILLFKVIPFGYEVIHTRYVHTENKLINMAVPKFSFFMKNNENSYSFKNWRGKTVLRNEIKNYLDTLEHISCNNTTYYYDSSTNMTFVDYSVKGNFIYSTISYNVRNGNYCNTLQIKEYQEKLERLGDLYTLNSEDSNLIIYFTPMLKIKNNKNVWIATLVIAYRDGTSIKKLEDSSGTFEIKDDELIYYRTKINDRSDEIVIPNISNFIIRERKLILKENYLEKYEKGIILK